MIQMGEEIEEAKKEKSLATIENIPKNTELKILKNLDSMRK